MLQGALKYMETYIRTLLLSILISIQICIQVQAAETQIVVKLKQHKVLQGQASHQLSALGICWRFDNHMIYYVDPNSSVYSQIFQGDILVSCEGMSPEQH